MTDIKKEIGYQLNPNVTNPQRCSRCQHHRHDRRNFYHHCGKHGIMVVFFGCCDDFEKEED